MSSIQSRMQRLVQCLIRRTIKAPWLTVVSAVVLAAMALWYTSTTLAFETSRGALASSSARYVQLQEALDQEFDKTRYIIVVVDVPHPQLGKQYVEALASRLRADTQHIKRVVDKIDSSSLAGKKLLYLSPEELRTLRQRLEDAQDFIVDLAATPGLIPLLTSINQEMAEALVTMMTGGLLEASTSATTSESSLDVGFLTALFGEMERAIVMPATYLFRSPWDRFFLEEGAIWTEEGFLTAAHDRFFFVLVDDYTTAGSFADHASSIHAIRSHIEALHRDFPDVRVGVTGEDALNTDEILAAQRDTLAATVIAMAGGALLFIVVFRQVWRPLLVMAMLVVAVCWTLGFTALTVGHLNILTVTFIPILIGLGIDFGIHLMARYGEERARQHDFKTAIQTAYRLTGPGIAAAALTTAVAFYAVMLTDFRGVIELGLIAGSGLLLCLLASFTVLPALLALCERHRNVPAGVWQPHPSGPRPGILRFSRTLLSVVGLATLAGAILLPMPRFDYNLLNLQAHGTESVIWEYRLLEETDRSSWYVFTAADSLEALYAKQAQLRALPVVDRVESLVSVIPEDQDIRLPLVQALAPYVEDLSGNWQALAPIDPEALHVLMQKLRFKLHREASEWGGNNPPSEAEWTAARTALLALQERLRTTPFQGVRAALETFQQMLMQDLAAKLEVLQRNVHPTPITLADAPAYLRQRFVSHRERYLLQIFARDSMWERQAMQDFVTQVQTVDADITGTPIIAYYAIQQIQRGYTRGGLYALLAIVGIVLLLFRHPHPVVLALIPLVFGGLWTIACMAFFGLPLNLANLIIVPLFLGIAVDDGIHLVHRWREDPDAAMAPLAHSTGKAIVLTSLTSMVGFGSLMVARHTGVFSLGLLTTISVGCSLLATLVVLPLASRLLPVGMQRPSPTWTPSAQAVSEFHPHPHRPARNDTITPDAHAPDQP